MTERAAVLRSHPISLEHNYCSVGIVVIRFVPTPWDGLLGCTFIFLRVSVAVSAEST